MDIATGPASRLLGPGSHGSTFGGNPVAAIAGLANSTFPDRSTSATASSRLDTIVSYAVGACVAASAGPVAEGSVGAGAGVHAEHLPVICLRRNQRKQIRAM